MRITHIRNLTNSIPRTMPWLMKAEPDSRLVKGKDVKVCTLQILS